MAAVLFLVVASAIAAPAERALWRVNHSWEAWRHQAAVDALAALRSALDTQIAASAKAASSALDAPADRADAFGYMDELVPRTDDAGLVLYRGDSAVAWAGNIHEDLSAPRADSTLIATPFYLALTTSARRGDTRATGVVLIDAASPADRLTSPLVLGIANRTGVAGFAFAPAGDAPPGPELLEYHVGKDAIFDVRAISQAQGQVAQQITERARARAGLALLLALACFIVGVWRTTAWLPRRVAALAVALGCTALVPFNEFSNFTRLFDPSVYYTALGGRLTGNAGALAITSALVLLALFAALRARAREPRRWAAALVVLVVAGLGPFLLRELSRGVQMPSHGVDSALWLIWEVPIFLAGVSVLLAGAAAGNALLGESHGLPPVLAPALAVASGVLAPVVWRAPGHLPGWYTLLWVAAIAMLALSRRTRGIMLSAAIVAAVGATTLVWTRTARGRVELAEADLAGLSHVDSTEASLVQRFGAELASQPAPASRLTLLKAYVASELEPAGYPTALFAWPNDSGPSAGFQTAAFPLPGPAMLQLAHDARVSQEVRIAAVPTDSAVELVLAAPSPGGGTTVVVTAPHSALFAPDPYAHLLGLDVSADAEPAYTLRIRAPRQALATPTNPHWRREASELHGDWAVRTGTRVLPVHVEVELRTIDVLAERGTLVVLLDLSVFGLLWMVGAIADGSARDWFAHRRQGTGRSYRARLSYALFGFFVLPAAVFAVWSYGQLADDVTQSRALLVGESLRAIAPAAAQPNWSPAIDRRLDSPLLVYAGGELQAADDPLYEAIAPLGTYLRPTVELELGTRLEQSLSRIESVDGTSALFGYRSVERPGAEPLILAAPAASDQLSLDRRRRDLGVLVLLATVLGGLAALWLSGLAARQLAEPIRTLREAALSVAAGNREPPLSGEPTVEFQPVFSAFRRMAADLHDSRTALEDAQRRTKAVLRNVGSGVIAVDAAGRISLANLRAEALVGRVLSAGQSLDGAVMPELWRRVDEFLRGSDAEEEFELRVSGLQLRGRLTRLSQGAGGAVVTLDDVTELARAQRVLAWGEMARQVAHEIKNPLTPIRLGVQHLRRARADKRVDFDAVLEQNVNQILSEIDRLDEIARSFSKYGAAPGQREAAVPVDAAAVAREVVGLERMGSAEGHAVAWQMVGTDAPAIVMARTDEFKEVLINLLENARLAGANAVEVRVERDEAPGGEVHVSVRDNGHGIAADVLPRIFEPHFSTRTSGSGLGLAISRQLVEGWGGRITVESTAGQGTVVSIRLATP
jgi:signal transduction histidine kinase